MHPIVPPELQAEVEQWPDLHQWERAELGRALRRLGLSYGEIRKLVPIAKGTLSYWCRKIRLEPRQIVAIKSRTIGLVGVPRDTQRGRRAEIARIRISAREEALANASDPFFVAGSMLYWAEGSKTSNELSLANSDPRISRLFVDWARTYHDPDAEFVLKLNLHKGNPEAAARAYWRLETGLRTAQFYKTYFKAEGTGHRKNHLPHGVCLVRMRRSTDAKHRTMAWIDALAERLRW